MRHRSFIQWFTPQMAIIVSSGLGQSQELLMGLQTGSPSAQWITDMLLTVWPADRARLISAVWSHFLGSFLRRLCIRQQGSRETFHYRSCSSLMLIFITFLSFCLEGQRSNDVFYSCFYFTLHFPTAVFSGLLMSLLPEYSRHTTGYVTRYSIIGFSGETYCTSREAESFLGPASSITCASLYSQQNSNLDNISITASRDSYFYKF